MHRSIRIRRSRPPTLRPPTLRSNKQRTSCDRVVACLLVLLVARTAGGQVSEPAAPRETRHDRTRSSQVTFVLADGIYINLGREDGVQEEAAGTARADSGLLGRFVVVYVSRNSSFLRLETPASSAEPLVTGTLLMLEFDDALGGRVADLEGPEPPTGDAEPFVPLLTPRVVVDARGSRNVFHGRVTARQWYQRTSDSDLDYFRTRLRTNGSIDRIDGTAWAFEWDADLTYRSGDGLEDVDRHEEFDPKFFRLAAVRRFDDRSIVRVGRFLPYELPSMGFVDGVQAEIPWGERIRWGGVAGLRPKRDTLDFGTSEPLLTTYLTYFRDDGAEGLFSATGGFMASLWDGDLDRGAFLVDQRWRRGKFSLTTHSVIDLDVGSSEVRSGTRLTELNVVGAYEFERSRLRLGVDRFELVDNDAERSVVEEFILPDTAFVKDASTRYWIGLQHDLSDRWSIDPQVSFTDERQTDGLRWSIGVTRRSLGSLEQGTLTARIFSLKSSELDGVGGQVSAFLPVTDVWSLYPSLRFDWANFNTGSEDFVVTEASVRSFWRLNSSWSMEAGATYGLADDDDRLLIDVGATYRW